MGPNGKVYYAGRMRRLTGLAVNGSPDGMNGWKTGLSCALAHIPFVKSYLKLVT
jgi:hypothetical protein